MPIITSLTYKPAGLGPDPDSHYLRVPLNEATLVAGRGIAGDLKGTPNRPLNVMSAETLAALQRDGLKTGPGQMGEQMVIEGLAVDTLAPGERLQIGASACIEVIKARTGCDRFAAIQGRSPEALLGRMGVIAHVVIGGRIRVGDPVMVLNRVTA